MKTRRGFVSNSSSSSYIIALAEVKNKDVVDEKFKEQLKGYDFDIFVANSDQPCDYCKRVEKLDDGKVKVTLESFDYNSVSLVVDEGSLIACYDGCYGDDSDFYDEEYFEPDYDIDFDFFPEDMQSIVKDMENEENGLVNCRFAFGAGRNG